MSMEPARPDAPEGVGTRRVRVGAIGLACVFLLVMLATVLLHAAADADLANHPAMSVNASEPAEPLAQLGVAPGNAPPDDPAEPPAASPAPPAGTPPQTSR